MILLLVSAAMVGFIHALAPGHWLPVVVMARARRWPARTLMSGACLVAAGHILMSIALGAASILIGTRFFERGAYEQTVEKYSSLLLILFGCAYALMGWLRPGGHHHSHHLEEKNGRDKPLLFLFTLGLAPCVAVLPVFIASSARGAVGVVLAMAAFAAGVLGSILGSSLIVGLGASKLQGLNHPWLESYSDVIAGACILLMGVALFFHPL